MSNTNYINPIAFAECASFTRATHREAGIILADNRIIERQEGTDEMVSFNSRTFQRLHQAGKRVDVVHSHPIDVPLSPQDLAMAYHYRAGVHVVTPDGSKIGCYASRTNQVEVALGILSRLSYELKCLSIRYHADSDALDTASQLLFARNLKSRGFVEGYYEDLGPVMKREQDYLTKLGYDESGKLLARGK